MVVVGVPFLAIGMWPLSRAPWQLLEMAYGDILGRDPFSAMLGHLLNSIMGVRSAACGQGELERGAFEQSVF